MQRVRVSVQPLEAAFFFQPVQFHIQPTNLLIQTGLSVILLALVLAQMGSENIGPLFKQLLLPLADLARVQLVVACQLVDSLV